MVHRERRRAEVTPLLSLVIPTRNGSAYPNLGAVQSACLSILQHQLEDYRIPSEIIVVEYNPDPNHPPLADSFHLDRTAHYTTIRLITVDPKYHRRFLKWRQRPFHLTCAVNIGLRRSRGEFFAFKSADTIYSEPLVSWLGQGDALKRCQIYRCDRADVDPMVLRGCSPGGYRELSRACAERVVSRHKQIIFPDYFHIPQLHSAACGDFTLMSREAWMQVRGLREYKYPVFVDDDSRTLYAAHALGNAQVILPDDCVVFKIDHGLKTVVRRQQVWRPRAGKFENFLYAKGLRTEWVNLSRALFNYPKRRDIDFEGHVFDSFERSFLLWAQLWGKGLPVVRQNYGNWGLRGEKLAETTLATAEWDRPGGLSYSTFRV